MKRTILCLSIALATLLNASAQNPEESYIEVHGTAEKTVVPDKITLSISINEKNYRNISLAQLEKDMTSTLKQLGLDPAKQLKVRDMSSVLKKERSKSQDAYLSKSYILELSDAVTATKVMAKLEEVGVSNIYVSNVEYTKMDELRLEVKAEAMRNAQKTARAMVSAIGQELGKAFYIYEQESGNQNVAIRSYGMKSAFADAALEEEAVPELEFREMKVSARVTVKFRL